MIVGSGVVAGRFLNFASWKDMEDGGVCGQMLKQTGRHKNPHPSGKRKLQRVFSVNSSVLVAVGLPRF